MYYAYVVTCTSPHCYLHLSDTCLLTAYIQQEVHVELMRRVEVVGLKSSTAIQAGYVDVDYSGIGGNVDGTDDSVSTIMLHLLTPLLTQEMERGFKSSFLQVAFHVFALILFSPK